MDRKLIALIILTGCDTHASDDAQSAYDEGYAQGYQDAAQDVEDRLAALEASVEIHDGRISAVETSIDEILPVVEFADTLHDYLTVDESDALGPALKVTGANVYVQSGEGSTSGEVNGLGNLIVGYNEDNAEAPYSRAGSHNLVVGAYNSWQSFGGLLVGSDNYSTAPYASVFGGQSNSTSGSFSAIVGGQGNTSSGDYAVVTGGSDSAAATEFSVVTAGQDIPSSIGAASSLALCRTGDLSGGTLNTTSDAIYIPNGMTGDEACDSFRSEAPCFESHYVFLSGNGHTETNVTSCSTPTDYSITDAVGAWACCNR